MNIIEAWPLMVEKAIFMDKSDGFKYRITDGALCFLSSDGAEWMYSEMSMNNLMEEELFEIPVKKYKWHEAVELCLRNGLVFKDVSGQIIKNTEDYLSDDAGIGFVLDLNDLDIMWTEVIK